MTVNYSDFFKHRDALEKLRDEKDVIGVASIKNPFEKLTVHLHEHYCRCSEDDYNECGYKDNWETDTEELLETMETLLKEDIPVDAPVDAPVDVTKKRKIQIED